MNHGSIFLGLNYYICYYVYVYIHIHSTTRLKGSNSCFSLLAHFRSEEKWIVTVKGTIFP